MEYLGISLWLWIVLISWSSIWKLLALWKSARKNHLAWFIALGILNTVGILDILYIYIFSEKTWKTKKEKKVQKTATKKRRK
jgi:methionyl-tRNA synthetase